MTVTFFQRVLDKPQICKQKLQLNKYTFCLFLIEMASK